MNIKSFVTNVIDTYTVCSIDARYDFRDFLGKIYGYLIEDSDTIKETNNDVTNNIRTLLSTDKPVNPETLKSLQMSIKNTQSCMAKSNLDTDLFIISTSDNPCTCRKMNREMLSMVLHDLLHYLTYFTPIEFKVNWILENTEFSDYELSKITHIDRRQIASYRKVHDIPLNMTLEHAIAFRKYYNYYVQNNFTEMFKAI